MKGSKTFKDSISALEELARSSSVRSVKIFLPNVIQMANSQYESDNKKENKDKIVKVLASLILLIESPETSENYEKCGAATKELEELEKLNQELPKAIKLIAEDLAKLNKIEVKIDNEQAEPIREVNPFEAKILALKQLAKDKPLDSFTRKHIANLIKNAKSLYSIAKENEKKEIVEALESLILLIESPETSENYKKCIDATQKIAKGAGRYLAYDIYKIADHPAKPKNEVPSLFDTHILALEQLTKDKSLDSFTRQQIANVIENANLLYSVAKKNEKKEIEKALESLIILFKAPHHNNYIKCTTATKKIAKGLGRYLAYHIYTIADRLAKPMAYRISSDELREIYKGKNLEVNVALKERIKHDFNEIGPNPQDRSTNIKQVKREAKGLWKVMGKPWLGFKTSSELDEKKEEDIANQLATLFEDKDSAEHYISGHSQAPPALLDRVIPYCFLNRGYDYSLTPDIANLKSINIFRDPTDGEVYLECRISGYIIREFENVMGFLDAPSRALFKLKKGTYKQENGKDIDDRWGLELHYLETENEDVFSVYNEGKNPFTKERIETRYCTDKLRLKGCIALLIDQCSNDTSDKPLTIIARKLIPAFQKSKDNPKLLAIIIQQMMKLISDPSNPNNFYQSLRNNQFEAPLAVLLYQFAEELPQSMYKKKKGKLEEKIKSNTEELKDKQESKKEQNLSMEQEVGKDGIVNTEAIDKVSKAINEKYASINSTIKKMNERVAKLSIKERQQAFSYKKDDSDFHRLLDTANSTIANIWLYIYHNLPKDQRQLAINIIKNPFGDHELPIASKLHVLLKACQYQAMQNALTEIISLMNDLISYPNNSEKYSSLEALAKSENLNDENIIKSISTFLSDSRFTTVNQLYLLKYFKKSKKSTLLGDYLLQDQNYVTLTKNKEDDVFAGLGNEYPTFAIKGYKYLLEQARKIENKHEREAEIEACLRLALANGLRDFFTSSGSIHPDIQDILNTTHRDHKLSDDELFRQFFLRMILKISATDEKKFEYAAIVQWVKEINLKDIEGVISDTDTRLKELHVQREVAGDDESYLALARVSFLQNKPFPQNNDTYQQDRFNLALKLHQLDKPTNKSTIEKAGNLFKACKDTKGQDAIIQSLFALKAFGADSTTYTHTSLIVARQAVSKLSQGDFFVNLIDNTKKENVEKPEQNEAAKRCYEEIIKTSQENKSSPAILMALIQEIHLLSSDANHDPSKFYQLLYENQFPEPLKQQLLKFKDEIPKARFVKLKEDLESIEVSNTEMMEPKIVTLTIPDGLAKISDECSLPDIDDKYSDKEITKALQYPDKELQALLRAAPSQIQKLWTKIYNNNYGKEKEYYLLLATCMVKNPFDDDLLVYAPKKFREEFWKLQQACRYFQLQSEINRYLQLSLDLIQSDNDKSTERSELVKQIIAHTTKSYKNHLGNSEKLSKVDLNKEHLNNFPPKEIRNAKASASKEDNYAQAKQELSEAILDKVKSENIIDRQLAVAGSRLKHEVEALEGEEFFDSARGIECLQVAKNTITDPNGCGNELPPKNDVLLELPEEKNLVTQSPLVENDTKSNDDRPSRKKPLEKDAPDQNQADKSTNIDQCSKLGCELGKESNKWRKVGAALLRVVDVALVALGLSTGIGGGYFTHKFFKKKDVSGVERELHHVANTARKVKSPQ